MANSTYILHSMLAHAGYHSPRRSPHSLIDYSPVTHSAQRAGNIDLTEGSDAANYQIDTHHDSLYRSPHSLNGRFPAVRSMQRARNVQSTEGFNATNHPISTNTAPTWFPSETLIQSSSQSIPQGTTKETKQKRYAPRWQHDETILLIKVINKHWDALKTTKGSRERGRTWDAIVNELENSKFGERMKERSKGSIQQKWDALVSDYKDAVDAENQTGAAPIEFEYYDEMANIMRGDHAVSPPVIHDSITEFENTRRVIGMLSPRVATVQRNSRRNGSSYLN
jgi:Myb/SANT-like DNA-binding domain